MMTLTLGARNALSAARHDEVSSGSRRERIHSYDTDGNNFTHEGGKSEVSDTGGGRPCGSKG